MLVSDPQKAETLPIERILELLEKMNDRPEGLPHQIVLYSDFSGHVQTSDGPVFDFNSPQALERESAIYLAPAVECDDKALAALKDLVRVIRQDELMPDSLSYMKRALEVIAESESPTQD